MGLLTWLWQGGALRTLGETVAFKRLPLILTVLSSLTLFIETG